MRSDLFGPRSQEQEASRPGLGLQNSKMLKITLAGEGVPLMRIAGRGDVFLADSAADVHVIDLEGRRTRCPSTAAASSRSSRRCPTTSGWSRARAW